MKQIAIVESVDIVDSIDRNKTIIKVKRDSACAGCKSESFCASCMKTVTSEAINEIGAKVGDTVIVESESKTILKYAVVTFILPIVFALIAYFITGYIFSDEVISNISMAAGFVIPLVILIIVVKNKKICDITITSIVSDADIMETGVQSNDQ